MKRLLLLLVFFQASFPIPVSEVASPHSSSQAKSFVNSKWFTGKEFQSTTFYAVNSILTNRKPTGPVEIVDLQGGFVVPALGTRTATFLAPSRTSRRQTGPFFRLACFTF